MIAALTEEMVLHNAWPEAIECISYGRTLLLDTCHTLVNNFPEVKDNKLQIKCDGTFTHKVSDMVSLTVTCQLHY